MGSKYKVILPYVFLVLYHEHGGEKYGLNDVFSRSEFPPFIDASAFEHFVVYYQQYKLDSFFKLGDKSVKMKDLHYGAIMTDDFANNE